jgi:hypothetical protein
LVGAIAFLFFLPTLLAKPSDPDKVQTAHTPDLSGIWVEPASVAIPANWLDSDGKRLENLPLTALGLAKFKANRATHGSHQVASTTSTEPIAKCLPPGVPAIYQFIFPMEIIQIPGRVIMFFEYGNYVRQIFTDGRKHQDLTPTWMGDSIGIWEGDTLIVDADGFNDKTWIDNEGHPHSDALHVVERIRRLDHDHLVDDITVEDAKTYTKTLTTRRVFDLQPDWNVAEFVCEDSDAFRDYEKKAGSETK